MCHDVPRFIPALFLALQLLLAGSSPAVAEADPRAHLELPIVVVDSTARPRGALAAMRSELARLLEPAVIEPVWLTPGTVDRGPFVGRRPFVVKVVIWRSDRLSRQLDERVLATVLGSADPDRQGDTMFLFWPAIVHHLRKWNGTASTAREEGRALARLVFHELAHLLAPRRDHEARGLMALSVERRLLVRAELPVDPDWLQAVRRGLLGALERPDSLSSSAAPLPAP